MAEIIFVTGGSRSGKSKFAEDYVLERATNPAYFATAIPFDDEMKQRVQIHQERRGSIWTNYALPYGLTDDDNELSAHDVILLDCLTLLVFNLMFLIESDYDHLSRERRAEIEIVVLAQIKKMLEQFAELPSKVVIVSNEIGLGIVPENALSRLYRDIVGRANQLVASSAENVYFVISGIPLKIKG